MPKNPFARSHRSSKLSSVDYDNSAAPPRASHEGKSPLQTIKSVGDKLRPHTNVTSAAEAPGAHESDVPAGTAAPIANRANESARNAGRGKNASSQSASAPQHSGYGQSGSGHRQGQGQQGQQGSSSYGQQPNNAPGGHPQNGESSHGKADEPSLDQRAQNQSKRTQRVMADDRDSPAPNADGANDFDFNERSHAQQVSKNADDYIGKGQDNSQIDAADSSGANAVNKPHNLGSTETKTSSSEDQKSRFEQIQQRAREGPILNDPSGAIAGATPGAAEVTSGAESHSFQSDRFDTPPQETTNQTPTRQAPGLAAGAVAAGQSPGVTARQPSPQASLSYRGLGRADGAAGLPVFAEVAKDRGLGAPKTIIGTPINAMDAAIDSTAAATGNARNFPNGLTAGGVGGAGGATSNATSSETSFASARTSEGRSTDATSRSGAAGGRSMGTATGPVTAAAAVAGGREVVTKPLDPNAQAIGHSGGGEEIEQGNTMKKEGVPGLSIGDKDPGIPGQETSGDKNAGGALDGAKATQPQQQRPSEDLSNKIVDKKLGTKSEQLQQQRQLASDYVGWRQVGGWDLRSEIPDSEARDLLQRSTLLEEYVSDKYYGDWYQNTALILATALLSWLIGKFGFSVSWLSLVLLIAGSAYRTSIRRLRRNYRDDVLRDMSLRSIEQGHETMEWLNSFLVKFWLIYEPSLSEMITQIANEVLKEQTPGFIDSLTLEKFTLGTKAPRIEYVRSFPKTDPTVAVMDWSMSFTPNDVMDLTARQLKNKVNPKVQLGIRVGKGPISQSFPILVEDMSFKGTMRVRLKLMSRFPHIQTVDVSFIEPPDFDFVLKPIGGDKLGFDVVKVVPGLSKFIKEMVNANLGPMFYAPNAFQVNLEQLMAGVGIMTGIGVLSVNIKTARNLVVDRSDGKVDPYVRLIGHDKQEKDRTKIKTNCRDPVWDQTLHMIVTNTSENTLLEVLDFNEKHNDRSIGTVALSIDKILDATGDDYVSAQMVSGGRPTGELVYSAHYAPVMMPTTDENGDVETPRDTKSGILALKVVGARNLKSTMSKVGQLSPFCEIEMGGKLYDSTKACKSTNEPDWQYGKEIIVTNKSMTQMVFRLRDNRGKVSPQIGVAKFRLPQLLVENQKERSWFPLSPEGSGEIQIETQWKPVAIPDASGSNYVEPVGVIRLDVKSARDLRNLEHIGKIDPYVRVFLGSTLVARTDWFQNTLSPQWDEVLYIPVQNELQELTVEVMDVEKRGADRSLGSFKIDLSKIIQKDPAGQYKVFASDKDLTNRLVMPNRGPKGTVTYGIEFFPAISIVAPAERDRFVLERKKIAELKEKKKLTESDKEELETREERLELAGVDMPLEEQLKFPAGVFAFSIESVDGVYAGQRLRVTADNKPFPIYVSPKARGRRLVIGESGDYVTGQFALSSLRFQILGGEDNVMDPKHVQGETIIGCHEMLKLAYNEPKTYEIGKAKMSLRARFFPIPELVISKDEDISQNGCIEVKLIGAKDVEAADSSGTSDPYCSFYLNNGKDKIYKSEIIKKTLNPEWNETFRFDIADVHESFLKAMVFDWDMGNRDDFLGGAEFSFADLQPLVWRDFDAPLMGIKKDKEVKHPKETKGSLLLQLRFSPGVLHKNKDDEMFGVKTVTKVGAAGVNAVGKVGGAGFDAGGKVLGGAGHAGSKVLGVFGRKSTDSRATEMAEDSVEYVISIDKITGLEGIKDVQIRAFTMAGREKEVFKSKTVKVEGSTATLEDGQFEVKALPNDMLGFKLREVKNLGRHSDIGQGTLELADGDQKVDFGGMTAIVNVSRV